MFTGKELQEEGLIGMCVGAAVRTNICSHQQEVRRE